jgi:hypothetical protein
MTHFPPPVLHAKRRRTLRVIGMLVSGLMVATVLGIFVLIFVNERAHDESICPFQGWSERKFSGGVVFEEQRNCTGKAWHFWGLRPHGADVTERRYRVVRGEQPGYELARKRLSTDRFAQDRYRWELSEDAGRIVIKVFVDDKLSSEFREEDVVGR